MNVRAVFPINVWGLLAWSGVCFCSQSETKSISGGFTVEKLSAEINKNRELVVNIKCSNFSKYKDKEIALKLLQLKNGCHLDYDKNGVVIEEKKLPVTDETDQSFTFNLEAIGLVEDAVYTFSIEIDQATAFYNVHWTFKDGSFRHLYFDPERYSTFVQIFDFLRIGILFVVVVVAYFYLFKPLVKETRANRHLSRT